jgi:hypothetical protein
MAYEVPGIDISLLSSGDMSSNQYRAVDASTTNANEGATKLAVRGGDITGVWQDNSTATTHGRVRTSGVTKMAAGDSSAMETAITQGLKVVASSVGQAVPSSGAGQFLLGISLGSLSTGSTGIIPVLLTIGAIST